MSDIQPSDDTLHAEATETRAWRRILITAGMVLAILILVAAAIYAVAFVVLAPMMQ
jgi:type IV secretory pathway VirB6-like protein